MSVVFSNDAASARTSARADVYRTRGVTLLVDDAHNAVAYAAIIATARRLAAGRLIGVVTAPGDRRDDDLDAIGRVCATGFDRLVVYEMDDRRGRAAGATAAVLVRGALAATAADVRDGAAGGVATVLDVREAMRRALAAAAPGDVVVVGCASHASDLREALGDTDLSPVDLAFDGTAPAAPERAAERMAQRPETADTVVHAG